MGDFLFPIPNLQMADFLPLSPICTWLVFCAILTNKLDTGSIKKENGFGLTFAYEEIIMSKIWQEDYKMFCSHISLAIKHYQWIVQRIWKNWNLIVSRQTLSCNMFIYNYYLSGITMKLKLTKCYRLDIKSSLKGSWTDAPSLADGVIQTAVESNWKTLFLIFKGKICSLWKMCNIQFQYTEI